MFTGIVTDVGEVLDVQQRAEGLRRLTIASKSLPQSIDIGASICCSGICLTVVEIAPRSAGSAFTVDVAAETLAVTKASQWTHGARLNLERSLRLGDELGGHMVSGHVDGLAEVVERESLPDMARLHLRTPGALARFIAAKGSISLDGVSLTVNEVSGPEFSVLIIPHTLAVTTLGQVKSGDHLNLEVDMMARYAARLLETK